MGENDEPRFEPCAGGLPGKCFVPPASTHKKHPCPDCFFCQWCSDDRCHACLSRQREGGAPLGPEQR